MCERQQPECLSGVIQAAAYRVIAVTKSGANWRMRSAGASPASAFRAPRCQAAKEPAALQITHSVEHVGDHPRGRREQLTTSRSTARRGDHPRRRGEQTKTTSPAAGAAGPSPRTARRSGRYGARRTNGGRPTSPRSSSSGTVKDTSGSRGRRSNTWTGRRTRSARGWITHKVGPGSCPGAARGTGRSRGFEWAAQEGGGA